MREKAFAYANRWFDRIWVVTIERAAARRERAAERLRGLDYAFHFGVDGIALDIADLRRSGVYDEDRARAVSRYSRAMTPGQIGCSLSHRQLWEETVRAGHRRVLVFEDDVVARDQDLLHLPATLEQLPAGWDLMYLGWTNFETVTLRHRAKQAAYVALSAARLMKWTPDQVLRFHPRPFSANLRRAGLHHCLHAYALSQQGARKLLEEQTPLAHVADQLPIHMVLSGRLDAYVAVPKLFDQEGQPGGAGSFIPTR